MFQSLGLIIHKDGKIENDVNYSIRGGWMKQRNASGLLRDDYRIPVELKGKFDNTSHALWY